MYKDELYEETPGAEKLRAEKLCEQRGAGQGRVLEKVLERLLDKVKRQGQETRSRDKVKRQGPE